MRVLVAFLLYYGVQSALADVDRKLIMSHLGQCMGREDLPIYIPDFRVEQTNRNSYIMSGDIVIRKSFPRGFTTSIDIKKCTDPSVADSCKTFLNNMVETDLCTMLDIPLPSYSSFVQTLDPPLKCPIKQITYRMHKFQVDDGLTNFFPLSRSIQYWNTTIRAIHDHKNIACVNLQLQVRPQNKRSPRN